ncbi:type II toxin-antitoxin system RelE/ParE family toxin [Candidatus Uhrbacteria bacterium]|nr:type II toxin-antitoxin system RelE/ParE family toxin [Candidatus Uhrbacteria bacterium]
MASYVISFADIALKDLDSLDKKTARRIIDKLDFFVKTENPFRYAQKLKDATQGEYRFRIGNYRVVFDIDSQGGVVVLVILLVRHRKDVYRGI